MIYSKYNYIFKSTKYGYLLYNAETNSFAEIDENLYNFLLRNKDNSDIKDELDIETMDILRNAKILVDNKDKNTYFYKKKLQYNLQNYNQKILGLVIAPTTYCNFNCFYCYEESRLPVFMDDKTIEDLIDFIHKYKNIEDVNIDWYGGEPLAAFNIIKKIIERFENEEKIKIGNHSLITNGYLLTEDKSIFFSKHPLNYVQITIDGIKETHDNRRKLLNGSGSTYDKIIENIEIFFKHNKETYVNIRVNIDSSNSDDYILLYNNLKERFNNPFFDVYPAFINDYTESCSTNCNVLNKDAIANFYIDLHKNHQIELNYYPILRNSGCGATRLNYFIIGPKGELYKCWNDLGNKSRIVGSISDDKILNENILFNYLVGPTMFEDEKCKSCEIFPICWGGCQWTRIENSISNRHFDLCTMRKNNMDKLLELHYEMKLKKNLQKA